MKEQVRAVTGHGQGKSLETSGNFILSLGKLIF